VLFYGNFNLDAFPADVSFDENIEDSQAVFEVEVLQTCKQICEEGLNILYGMNAFCFNILVT
jgi:hypothetical protein